MSASSTVTATPAENRRNPLQPLLGIIQVLYYLTLAVFLLSVAEILFRSGGTFGWNGGTACLDVPGNLQPKGTYFNGSWVSVTTSIQGERYCVQYASHQQAFYSTLANGLGVPFFLVAFGLTSRLLGLAAKNGFYRAEVVSRIHFLGWVLIGGEVLHVALRTIGSVHLYNQLVPNHFDGTYWTGFWHVNWTVLLIGAVLLTLTRILREGVGMREDLDGTV